MQHLREALRVPNHPDPLPVQSLSTLSRLKSRDPVKPLLHSLLVRAMHLEWSVIFNALGKTEDQNQSVIFRARDVVLNQQVGKKPI
jgi:hypothetical protein